MEGPRAAAADPSVSELAEKRIAQLILQLDDDRFIVREGAQRELAALGEPALLQVGKAAQSESLETSTRTLNILLEWSGNDSDTFRLATLGQLAQLKNRPAEAKMAKNALDRVREQVALTYLLKSGVKIQRDLRRNLVRSSHFNLQVVLGPDTKVDEQVLTAIADVRSATIVSFHSAEVSEELLKTLESAKQLTRLEFYGTPVSKAMLARLKEKMPHLQEIDVRSGARLGVRGDPVVQNGRIGDVEKGSAADRAGLRKNDVVTHVDGEAVKSFEHLIRLVAKHNPTETALLTVERSGALKPLEIEVTFDRWGEEDLTDSRSTQITLHDLRQRSSQDHQILQRRR
ncbi:PDZ domain-containing protein [Adhaeretor mobilis]|uniref:PDZ domain-containing protein n=1 Tax=Adhaeretor mobilis TaxID=1930276 RepID=UPI0011A2601E|nr:PDZ domain-containing protein [Adhaeretor mobilis]